MSTGKALHYRQFARDIQERVLAGYYCVRLGCVENQVVNTGDAADGSTMTDGWTIKSPTLEESDGTGVSPQGTAAARKLRIEKKPDEFTWTASRRTEGGKALPDLIIAFRRVEK